jgi:hypothetical protein
MFDSEWGTVEAFGNTTRGRWALCDEDGVKAEILRRAGMSEDDLGAIGETARKAGTAFDDARFDLLASLDAVLATNDDPVLRKTRGEIDALQSHMSEWDVIQSAAPAQFMTRDSAALSEGRRTPPHLQLEARRVALLSYGLNLSELAKRARYVEKYLEKRLKMGGKSIARTDGKIFIGHGRSVVGDAPRAVEFRVAATAVTNTTLP